MKRLQNFEASIESKNKKSSNYSRNATTKRKQRLKEMQQLQRMQ